MRSSQFTAATAFLLLRLQGHQELDLEAEVMAGKGMVEVKEPLVPVLAKKTAGIYRTLEDTTTPCSMPYG
ncbi:MAG: hypothetical protein AB7U29_00450 [Desulfobulbus sp.]